MASRARGWLLAVSVAVLVVAAAAGVVAVVGRDGVPTTSAMPTAEPPLPSALRGTGLYAPGSMQAIAAGNLAFSPRYPLWSDGAAKRRWIRLPPRSRIDGSAPDAWTFPVGTRFWKEFSYRGRPIETRFLERVGDGRWRYATYVWNEDGSDAVLAPAAGLSFAVPRAPTGRYAVPSVDDCRACHEGAATPVLGFSAVQLARDGVADRAPAAPGSVDLRGLVGQGLLDGFPAALVDGPPAIAATSPLEEAALGYLHGNCGHCHRGGESGVPVALVLAQTIGPDDGESAGWRNALGAPSRFRPAGAAGPLPLIAPGAADASVLALRMRSRDPLVQMPPLGTQVVDARAVALIDEWIDSMPAGTETER